MVYKKYIRKNGKLYGPYLYHSKRIDGKVISEYHGIKPSYKRFIIFSLGIVLLISLIIFLFNFNGKITGKTISNPEINPQLQNSLVEEKTIYPEVYFTLISKQIQIDNPEEIGKEQNEPESQATEQDIIKTEEPNENQTYENKTTGNAEENVTNIEPQQNETSEIISGESGTNDSLDITPETTENSGQTEQESAPAEQETTSAETQDSEQTTEENSDSPEQENPSEETSDTDTSSDSSTESSESEEPSVTPVNIILGMLKTVSNFFLGLKPTGMTISEPTITEINGQVSLDEPFTYNLGEGETINLLSGSVRTDSETLSDDAIEITYQDNQVLISTNYSETESGIFTNQTNETSYVNLTDNFYLEPLTEEENAFLAEKLGNTSVEKVKSELFKGRYIIEYEFGKYSIEYSYDSNLNNETLKMQMENDRIKWVRDIIKELSENKSVAEPVELF